jgi:hypothetical protein
MSDTYLNLEELVSERKQQEEIRLKMFREQLNHCFALIKRYNRERHHEMEYHVPSFILGKPIFDPEALTNFLLYHLRQNGLRAERRRPGNVIWVSWREADLNLEQYLTKKSLVEQHRKMFYLADDNLAYTLPKPATASIQDISFRQQRQRQLEEARQLRIRLREQQHRPPQPTVSEFFRSGFRPTTKRPPADDGRY